MRKAMSPGAVLGAMFLVAGLWGASGARADGFGPRVGLTGDPDQVHMGMHFPTLPLSPNLGFMASFEVGVGDNTTLFSGNMDFKYIFPTRTGSWRPYAGVGPALHLLDRDNVDDDMEVGLGLFGGMQTATRSGAFFGEMRLGVADSPDFKFTVGWMFH